MELKKLSALVLGGALAMSMLTACGGGEEAPAEDTAPETAVEDTTSEATEEVVEEEVVEEEDVEEEPVEEEAAEEEAAVIDVPVYIANGTGADFVSLYISVAGEENWGENLLSEGEVLADGTATPDLMLSIADEEGLTWDLMVEDPEGTTLEWYGLDFSEMPTDGFAVELTWDGESGTAFLAATPDELQGTYTAAY